MMSFNLHLILFFSHFLVHQVIGNCTGSYSNIYNVCTFESLYQPTKFDINIINKNYDDNEDNDDCKYKIIITKSIVPNLSSHLFSHHNIAVLEITDCNVNHLNISDLKTLIKIDISHNNITNFDDLYNLEQLQVIDLSYNNITNINSTFSSPKIDYFNVSNNNIRELPDTFNVPSLVSLDLCYNYINNVNKTFFNNLELLEILQICNNNITTLKLGIFSNLKSLKNLDLSHNHIKTLEYSSLSGLNMLETLDLSYNYITSIPGILYHNLNNLKSLNVNGNQLTKLESNDLLDTIELTEIAFDGNPMTCEMISYLLKQFRKGNVKVLQGSSHGNSSIYGMHCVKADEYISSKNDNVNELVEIFFQEVLANLNSSIIQDKIKQKTNPNQQSNLQDVFRNFTNLIERNEKGLLKNVSIVIANNADISNIYSQVNNMNNKTREVASESISKSATFIWIALLLVLISILFITQIAFQIYLNNKMNRKPYQNELLSIGEL